MALMEELLRIESDFPKEPLVIQDLDVPADAQEEPDVHGLPPSITPISNFHVLKDIPYYNGKDVSALKHKLNVYIPSSNGYSASPKKYPVILHIHGGGWKRGDRSQWFYGAPFMASNYCRRGFVCFTISYRLSKEAQHPAQIIDVARAVKWIYDRVELYAGDRDRFYVSGHSAGGHLASLITLDTKYLKDENVDPSFIKGTVCLSGIYNLKAPIEQEDSKAYPIGNYLFQVVYGKANFGTSNKVLEEASPITHVHKADRVPPFLVINATVDLGLEQGAARFVEELGKKGASVQHCMIDGTTHGTVTRSHSTIEVVDRWIRSILLKSSS